MSANGLPREVLHAKIRKQIEFYLSEANLRQDTYLVPRLSVARRIRLDVLAGFPKMQQLTTDLAEVVTALRSSNEVVLKRNKARRWYVSPVRPVLADAVKLIWKTSDLRDVPSDNDKNDLLRNYGAFRNVSFFITEFINGDYVLIFLSQREAETMIRNIHEAEGLGGLQHTLEPLFRSPEAPQAVARGVNNTGTVAGAGQPELNPNAPEFVSMLRPRQSA